MRFLLRYLLYSVSNIRVSNARRHIGTLRSLNLGKPLFNGSKNLLNRAYGAANVNKAQAEERVLAVLGDFNKVDKKTLALDTPFTQLGLDSLDVVEVMIALEDEFHMEIPDAVADKVQTPKEIAEYIYNFLNPHKPTQPDHYSENSTSH